MPGRMASAATKVAMPSSGRCAVPQAPSAERRSGDRVDELLDGRQIAVHIRGLVGEGDRGSMDCDRLPDAAIRHEHPRCMAEFRIDDLIAFRGIPRPYPAEADARAVAQA